MMLRRAAPSGAGPETNSPLSSGPRCRSVSIMRDSRAGSGRSAFSERNPAIPHIGLGMSLSERFGARMPEDVRRQLTELSHRVFVPGRRRARVERDVQRRPDVSLDVVARLDELFGAQRVGEDVRVMAAIRVALVV